MTRVTHCPVCGKPLIHVGRFADHHIGCCNNPDCAHRGVLVAGYVKAEVETK
jgi:ssDNA-binding Zn-finger/Zn-ribbon topoisomerase 1